MAYPTSPITFSTKNAGDTIQPAHVNDLQTEVTAIESALLTGGLAHALFPSANDGYALGSASKSWSDLFLASGAVINWNNGGYTATHTNATSLLTLSGALSVTGGALGAMGIVGNMYNHVLVAVGYQSDPNPLTQPHQVGVYSAVTGNSYTAVDGGTPATRGYVIGFETALGTHAGGTVPWAVNYSIGSITKDAGDTLTRTVGYAVVDETAGTNNAAMALYDDQFTGNWFIRYTGTRASYLGGNLIVGADAYRSVATSYLRLSGGDAAGSGANVAIYGQSHATLSNQIVLSATGGMQFLGTGSADRMGISAAGVVTIGGKALTFGANDSGGAGYRTVTIANA